MQEPLISIIIPVYNAEHYVGLMLDSILQQKFTDFEILLINDGSKDSSASICAEYEKQDKRITFIDKANEGVAITRNRALDMAKGQYVMFVDADDIVFPDTFGKIAQVLQESNADLLRFDFNTIDENGQFLYPNHLRKKRRRYNLRSQAPVSFAKKIIRSEYFLCMHVFRRSLLNKHKIRFMEGCTYNEDTLFILQFLQHAQNCIYTDTLLYGYRKYRGAVTANFTPKNYADVKTVFWSICHLAEGKDKEMQRLLFNVAGTLALHIYQHAEMQNLQDKDFFDIQHFCIKNLVSTEWEIRRILPSALCNKAWGLLRFLKKVSERV